MNDSQFKAFLEEKILSLGYIIDTYTGETNDDLYKLINDQYRLMVELVSVLETKMNLHVSLV
jgi:hypothetical protein